MTEQHPTSSPRPEPSTTRVLPAFPKPDLRCRFSALFVKYFPLRLFRFLRTEPEKYMHESVLLTTDLAPIAHPDSGPEHQMGVMDETILAEVLSHPESLPEKVYRRRLARGDICYFQRVNGALANYSWVSLSRCGVFCGLDREMYFRDLADSQAFNYDLYTYRSHRKQGYGSILQKYVRADLYRRGIRTLVYCIEPTNHTSLKMHLRLDHHFETVVSNFFVMKLKWTVLSRPRRNERVAQWLKSYKAFHQL
ncbi:MAG: GNAT family N-acetyltransferase [Pseudomonadales bacterium]|nr:GNAT family N-acetyltransferase [Halioglobus sp.]MCP5193783.1 GNAT family N-acetyltransferase [Pseudomonadales bacterium]